MSDVCERLVRFAGKVCLSTDTEVEAADEIERLRAENEKLNGVIQSYQITLETQQGEILRLRAELAQADEMLKRQAMTIKSLQAALEDDDGLTTAYLVGLHTGRDERKVSSQVILDNSNDEVG